MDFLELKKKIKFSQKSLYNGFSERMFDLSCYRKVLDGTLYDCLQYAFFQKNSDGAASAIINIPMSQRRPSVRSRLNKVVVDDSVSLLFGEGRFPAIQVQDPDTQTILNDIVKASHLNQIMMEAAYKGSVGSSAILFSLLENRLFFQVLCTEFLIPKFNKYNPEELEKVTELQKFNGEALMEMGWTDLDKTADYWLEREWNVTSEIYYKPYRCNADNPVKERDDANSTDHNFGVVPLVWIKNLPGGNDPDGFCTFADGIDTNIELDYQLSQSGRGLRYSNDPLLKVKNCLPMQGAIDLSQSNVLLLDEGGDADLIEIKGDAVDACLAYTKRLREIILENVHGNRTNPDKINAAQSGRALELLHQPLIGLADKLRISYGEKGLRQLLGLIVLVNQKNELIVNKKVIKVGQLKVDDDINLVWTDWFPATRDDRMKDANTLRTLTDSGLMSGKTAVSSLANEYDFDADEELILIKAYQKERMKELQPTVTETVQA